MNGTLAIVVWAQSRDRKPRARTPSPKQSPRRLPPWLSFQSFRDVVFFVAGLAGLYHQFVIAEQAQWVLVVVAAAMAGIPLPLRLDEIRRNGSNGS